MKSMRKMLLLVLSLEGENIGQGVPVLLSRNNPGVEISRDKTLQIYIATILGEETFAVRS